MGMLGALEPQEEAVKSVSGNDREGSNNILASIAEENKEQGVDLEENQVEEAPVPNFKEAPILKVEEGGEEDVR